MAALACETVVLALDFLVAGVEVAVAGVSLAAVCDEVLALRFELENTLEAELVNFDELLASGAVVSST